MSSIFAVPQATSQQQLQDAYITPEGLSNFLAENGDFAAAQVNMNLDTQVKWYAQYMGIGGQPWAFASADHYIRQVWTGNPNNNNNGWTVARGDPTNFVSNGADYIANGVWVQGGQLFYFWDIYLLQPPNNSTLWLPYPFFPTTEAIENVQKNLASMNGFNTYVYGQVGNYAANTVWMALTDKSAVPDPGLTAGSRSFPPCSKGSPV